MSYILDALKKSEAERNQYDGRSLLNYPNQKQIAGIPIWLIVIVTIAVNICAMLLWSYWPATNENPKNKAPEVLEIVLPDKGGFDQGKVELPSSTAQKAVKESKMEPPGSRQPVLAYPDSVVPFMTLNRSERDAFPQVTFSTHVYSEDPAFRVLIANGLRLTEGEMLSDTVKLITISENGAVFLHANRLVEIPVLQDWRTE